MAVDGLTTLPSGHRPSINHISIMPKEQVNAEK
jgi:hypothetical protein